jgi:thiamine pyrophosphokinase
MSTFVVLLGGRLKPTNRLAAQIRGARIIAADSGMSHAKTLGLKAELWVGDFDSTNAELAQAYAHVGRHAYPTEKDMTDGEIAIREAINRGASALILLGGMGGRADHTLGHFGLTLSLANKGYRTMLTSGDEEAHPLIPGNLTIDLPEGTSLSLVPFADLEGFSMKGVKWPLSDRRVPLGSSLTLSNIATGPVRMDLAKGYGVAIAHLESD